LDSVVGGGGVGAGVTVPSSSVVGRLLKDGIVSTEDNDVEPRGIAISVKSRQTVDLNVRSRSHEETIAAVAAVAAESVIIIQLKATDAVLGVLNAVTVIESILTTPKTTTVISTTVADVSVDDGMSYTMDNMFCDPESNAECFSSLKNNDRRPSEWNLSNRTFNRQPTPSHKVPYPL